MVMDGRDGGKMRQEAICFFQSSGRYEARRLEGVYAFARKKGWHVLVIDRAQQQTSLRKILAFWRPVGCIVEGMVEATVVTPRTFGSLPVVFCDVSPSVYGKKAWERRASFVKHDSSATTRLAVRELRALEWKNLAYVGFFAPTYWSDERASTFRAETADLIGGAHVFLCDRKHPFRDALDLQRRLRLWLRDVPKPCGILAANDFMGEQVLIACRELGIDIPHQVALIGIDNEELRCENLRPTLTSVEPDFVHAGQLAAELLDDLIAGAAKAGDCRLFGPARIVRRQTTAVTLVRSRVVSDALEMIRLGACSGLKAADVLAAMGGSRSAAERLFRRATGCSVLERIEARRFEEVQRLLARKEVKIDSIADFCGYRSGSFLRKRFKERTGMTMQAWRERGDPQDRIEAVKEAD